VQTQGSLLIAKSIEVQLAPEVLEAVRSPVADTRLGVVPQLGSLLTSKDRGLRHAARRALTQLAEDDSRKVSGAAARALAEVSDAGAGDTNSSASVEQGQRGAPARTSHRLSAGPERTMSSEDIAPEAAYRLSPVIQRPSSPFSRSWAITAALVSLFLIPSSAAATVAALYANRAAGLSPYIERPELASSLAVLTFLVACLTLPVIGVLLTIVRLDQPDSRTLQMLSRRLDSLWDRLHAAADVSPESGSTLNQVRSLVQASTREASRHGVQWLTGSGYLAVLDLIEDAEDEFFRVAPLEDMLEIAGTDLDRLNRDSADGNRHFRASATKLIEQLKWAMDEVADASIEAKDPVEVRRRRDKLRQVRQDIYAYRIQTQRKLVGLRQRFGWLILLAGVVTYVFVAIGVIAAAPSEVIGSSLFAYIVGAIAGLAAVLMHDLDTELPDAGVSALHRVSIPLVSGLLALVSLPLAESLGLGPVFPGDSSVFTGQILLLSVGFGLLPEAALVASRTVSRWRDVSDRESTPRRD
jgi:hypothetical protein